MFFAAHSKKFHHLYLRRLRQRSLKFILNGPLVNLENAIRATTYNF
jgi:hypothetical protein